MKKNIKVLLTFVCILLAFVALSAVGLAIYRTTPHYQLRHEHYADVTLDDGTVVRFLRRPNMEEKSFYDEVVIKEIQVLGSDTLVFPSYVGGYPVTEIGYYGAEVFPNHTDHEQGIKSLTLPDELTIFNFVGQMFKLESLHIGKATCDFPSIDAWELKEITVHPDNVRYKVEGGCLIDKNTNTVVLGTVNSVIPEGVIGIDDYAFYWLSITELALPNSLQSIGDAALTATSITALTLPDGLTSLGSHALAGTKIKELVIPDGVQTIPSYLLSSCAELETLTIGKGVSEIDTTAFYGCKKLSEIIIHPENPAYYTDGTSLLRKDDDKLIYYFGNAAVSSKAQSIDSMAISAEKADINKVIIPSNIEKILLSSIYSENDPLYIFIPMNVTEMEKDAIIIAHGAIYCEASEKPVGWDENWTRSDVPIYWGCAVEEFTALETKQ